MSRQAEPKWKRYLSSGDFYALSVFNAEVDRGLLHTKAYRDKMARLQDYYNRAMRPIDTDL